MLLSCQRGSLVSVKNPGLAACSLASGPVWHRVLTEERKAELASVVPCSPCRLPRPLKRETGGVCGSLGEPRVGRAEPRRSGQLCGREGPCADACHVFFFLDCINDKQVQHKLALCCWFLFSISWGLFAC